MGVGRRIVVRTYHRTVLPLGWYRRRCTPYGVHGSTVYGEAPAIDGQTAIHRKSAAEGRRVREYIRVRFRLAGAWSLRLCGRGFAAGRSRPLYCEL